MSNQPKQMQMMMNISLLSSLKSKQEQPMSSFSRQINPQIQVFNPQNINILRGLNISQVQSVQPPSQIQAFNNYPINQVPNNNNKVPTQMSFYSVYSPHSTILSYQLDDKVQTNDSSFHNRLNVTNGLNNNLVNNLNIINSNNNINNSYGYSNNNHFTAPILMNKYNDSLFTNIVNQPCINSSQIPSSLFNINTVPENNIHSLFPTPLNGSSNNNNLIVNNINNINNLNDIAIQNISSNNLQIPMVPQNTINSNYQILSLSPPKFQKSYTTMSFHLLPGQLLNSNSSQNSNNLLGKKIHRNTIIINNSSKHPSEPIKSSNIPIFKTQIFKEKIEMKEEDKNYKCEHDGCGLFYKTKKQRVSHHSKMDPECLKDSLSFLHLVKKSKKIISGLVSKKKIKEDDELLDEIKQKYERIIKDVSFDEYAILICGDNFNIKE